MERKEVNKKMQLLKKTGLLDNFTRQQKRLLKILIKNELDYIIVENDQKATEKNLFKAKGIMPL